MSKSSENTDIRSGDAIEALLKKAAPRPIPPAEDEQVVRDAVVAEWEAVAGRVKLRQRVKHFAIAAAILLGVAISFNALQVSNERPAQVATIHKNFGSIYLVGEQSLLQEASDLSSVFAGQIIETGNDAGVSLELGGGGSLRIDKNTRIEFTSADSVYLRSGQIYFDSRPSTVAAIKGSGLEIGTDLGFVRHLGTQYITAVDRDDLRISVREGEVEFDGKYIDKEVAVAGQQMTISGGAAPSVLDIDGFGEIWAWAENLAPVVSMNGKTTYEFLERVSHETGLALVFESKAAEDAARAGELFGTIDTDPRSELAIRMAGEDLGYRIDRGAIYVSFDSSSRQ